MGLKRTPPQRALIESASLSDAEPDILAFQGGFPGVFSYLSSKQDLNDPAFKGETDNLLWGETAKDPADPALEIISKACGTIMALRGGKSFRFGYSQIADAALIYGPLN